LIAPAKQADYHDQSSELSMLLLQRQTESPLGTSLPRLISANLMVAIVASGLLLRLLHYSRDPAIWQDEAAVVHNILSLNFHQMLGPLLNHQAAPPLFLMGERAVVLCFGDSLVALRLLPFVASCLSLILFALLAQRILAAKTAIWAVALFAASDRLLWHAIEVKPYSIDVLVAVAAAYGYVASRHWPVWKQSLLWLSMLPIAIWLSYTACFVCGGLFIGLLPALLRSRFLRDWSVAIAVVAAVGTSFFLLANGPVTAQRDGTLESYWSGDFADWQRPWTIPVWMLQATFDVLWHCLAPQGWLLAGLFVAGAIHYWRTRQRCLLAVLIAPLGLVMFAAMLGKYPYGGSRLIVFITPAICLLVAAGVPWASDWCRRRWPWAVVAVWLVLCIPILHTVRRAIVPWSRYDIDVASQYVLENWRTDDGVGFDNWESQYLFRHQKSAWYDPDGTHARPFKRLWYTTLGANPSLPGWKLVEIQVFTSAKAALYLPTNERTDSTR
jgi:hypothetical protein